MRKLSHHIFVCASFRSKGEAKGACHKKGSSDFLPYIENELIDRGLEGVMVSSTSCMKACDHGPIMIIYPDNLWYGGVENEDIIDEILDAMEDGEIVEAYLLNN